MGTTKLPPRLLLLCYGIAPVAVTLAALVQWALLGPGAPFLLLLPAIMVIAWYGGLGPGLLATALGAVEVAYLFFEPRFSLRVEGTREMVALTVFVFVGTAITMLCERLRRSEQARRQAEEQVLLNTKGSLRESRERLRAVVQTAVDAIITIDERGIIDSVNAAAERMFGYSAAEIIGQNVSLLMPSPYREEHDGYLARYMQTGEKRIIGIGREVQGRRKLGLTFPADLAVSEWRDQGRRMFTGVIRDVSARKELEREVLQAATLEQRRIGQALHDSTGQELTALGLLAESLTEVLEKQPPAASLAAKIKEGLQRVLAQVRAYSRGLIPVEVDTRGLTAALTELAARTSEVHGATCTFECPQSVEIENNQVATHLYHIAQEAVTNAIRHALARHLTIRLEINPRSITLRVTDDGVGFKEPVDSKGMGLKIMRYRAGLINARLAVEQAEPFGTVVSCTLNKSAIHGQEQDGGK
jgi:PAS domain S-box-containing protein